MNKQLHLFKLIKSLTKSEKRYFKLFNSTFEGKNKTNLKLFNGIEKQKTYNEAALKKQFASESFVKHFAVVKSNLYTMILKSLRVYYANMDAREKINQHKENFRILVRKGLIDLSRVQLEKGMKLATEHEIFEDKILIASWQNSLNAVKAFRNNKNKDIEENLIKPIKYLDELNDRHQYAYLANRIDFLILQNTIRSKSTQIEIERILKLPEMQKDAIPQSFCAIDSKNHVLLACYVGMKDYEKAYLMSKQIVQEMLDNPVYTKLQPLNLSSSYNNYIHTAIRVLPLDKISSITNEYLAYLNRMKAENINLADMEERFFDNHHFYKIEYYLTHNQFAEVLVILPEVEAEFVKIEDQVSSFLHLYFNYSIAYAHYMCGNFVKSHEYTVKLINYPQLKNRNDYFAATHLLKLFVHFELGNYEHLSCELKNVRELLKRNNYLFEFEKEAIGMLQKLRAAKEPIMQQEIYQNYKFVFEGLFNQIEERDAFEKMNILYWIDQKLKQTNVIETKASSPMTSA